MGETFSFTVCLLHVGLCFTLSCFISVFVVGHRNCEICLCTIAWMGQRHLSFFSFFFSFGCCSFVCLLLSCFLVSFFLAVFFLLFLFFFLLSFVFTLSPSPWMGHRHLFVVVVVCCFLVSLSAAFLSVFLSSLFITTPFPRPLSCHNSFHFTQMPQCILQCL